LQRGIPSSGIGRHGTAERISNKQETKIWRISTKDYVGFSDVNLAPNTTNINGAGRTAAQQWWIYSLTWNVFCVIANSAGSAIRPSAQVYTSGNKHAHSTIIRMRTNFATATNMAPRRRFSGQMSISRHRQLTNRYLGIG